MVRICVWGDSITYGASDSEKGGWVNRLNLSFGGKDEDINVYNVGISGDRTYDLIERFEIECKKRNPDLILFAIGTNDSQYTGNRDNPSTSLEKFRDNLQWLIDSAKKYSDKIGFVGLTRVDESKVMPIPWRENTYYDNENIEKYDLIIKDVCISNKIFYLHMLDLLNNSLLNDGLHPNSLGHEKMFLKIKDFIVGMMTTDIKSQ